MTPIERIRELLSKPLPAPSKDWARRILDDAHASELQKRMAREALVPRFRRNREPGEDWEEE